MPTICSVSDEFAAAAALGGKFDRENCSFFETCDHTVEKHDMTVNPPTYVEISYCSLDWKKVGPSLVFGLLLFFLMYRRMSSITPSSSMSGYSKYYKP